ncbi:MAG: hypothetical protein Q9201_006728 [Fulgogasparrea decipioides]
MYCFASRSTNVVLAPTTPASYISSTTLPPQAPSIISRSSSRTKLRSAGPVPVASTSASYTMDGGGKTSRAGSRHRSRRGTSTQSHDADSSWLTRTASALATHTMEEKGQGWLASRASATSLVSPSLTCHNAFFSAAEAGGADAEDESYAKSAPQSRYGSRVQSRVQSRVGSRAGSRADLRMAKGSQIQMFSSHEEKAPIVQGIEDIGPDFVNLEDEPDVEREEVVDEMEMRKLVWGRLGGWVDWMVGWMDLRDEREEDGREQDVRGTVDDLRDRTADEGSSMQKREDKDEIEGGNRIGVTAPSTGGVWEDARWLLKIAGESL